MTKSTKRNLAVAVVFILFSFFAFYLYQNREIFQEIKKIQPIYAIPIIGLSIVGLYINGLQLKLLCVPFNVKLKEHFLISSASSFFNMITPLKGGAGFRAIYMKKIHKLKYSEFIASLFGNYIIIFLTSSLTALATFIVIYLKYQIFNIFIILAFATLLITTLSLITFNFTFKKENFITSKINKVLKGWKQIRHQKIIIFKISLLILCSISIRALMLKLAFNGLGFELALSQAIYLSVVRSLAAFLNITPGSLGITETVYFITASTINLSPGITLIVALIIRALNTITLGTLGPISNILLLKKTKKTQRQIILQKTTSETS